MNGDADAVTVGHSSRGVSSRLGNPPKKTQNPKNQKSKIKKNLAAPGVGGGEVSRFIFGGPHVPRAALPLAGGIEMGLQTSGNPPGVGWGIGGGVRCGVPPAERRLRREQQTRRHAHARRSLGDSPGGTKGREAATATATVGGVLIATPLRRVWAWGHGLTRGVR